VEYYLIKLSQTINSIFKVSLSPTQTFLLLTLIVILLYSVLILSLHVSRVSLRRLSPKERVRRTLLKLARKGESVRELSLLSGKEDLISKIEEFLYNPKKKGSHEEAAALLKEIKRCASYRESGKGES